MRPAASTGGPRGGLHKLFSYHGLLDEIWDHGLLDHGLLDDRGTFSDVRRIAST